MAPIVIPDTNGLNTHGNELSAPVGSTSVAKNAVFNREGMPERRRGFKDHSANLPDFAPMQLLASAAGDQAYLHLDHGIWYLNGSEWTRKGGTAISAIRYSSGIWLNAAGTKAYVCDEGNHAVFAIDLLTSYVSLIAGLPGTSGTANGTGTVARFNTPSGIWGDGTNLYVADYGNFAIRKIVIATGVVTTFAGLIGTAAHTDNATGTSARFQSPFGIWGDGTSLYVSENADGYIRKIAIGGSQAVTTLVSGLTTPSGVWIAAGGSTLYAVTNATTIVKSINATSGATSNLATGVGGAGGVRTLMHSDGTYLWIAGWDGVVAYRVTIAGGAVDNTVFTTGISQQRGVWVASGKIYITGNGIPLAVAYPSTDSWAYLIQNPGTAFSSGALTLTSVVGPD